MAEDVTKIIVKRDASELFGDIEVPYYAYDKEDNPEQNGTDIENRKQVWGALVPIVLINGIQIQEQDLISLTLSSKEELPYLYLNFKDPRNVMRDFNQPKAQNNIQVVIIPQFDGIYKKIKLEFFMQNIDIQSQGNVYCEGIYKVNKLYSDLIKTYGELTTDEFLDKIGLDFGLGYATHIKYKLNDKHYRFINNIKPIDALKRDITFSGSTEQQIYDFFIDFWNNINLIDYYIQLNNLTAEQQYCVVSTNMNEVVPEGSITETDKNPKNYCKQPMIYTNSPGLQTSPLYIDNYNLISEPGLSLYEGSEKEFKYSNEVNFKHEDEGFDIILQDVDKDSDKILRSSFIGREYEKIPILKQRVLRNSYLQKMKFNTLVLNTSRYNFGVLRGGKLDVEIYETDNINKNIVTENESNIENNETMYGNYTVSEEDSKLDSTWVLNKYLSGQYTVIGIDIVYKGEQLGAKYYLTRNELKKEYLKEK